MQLFVIHFANYLIPPTGKRIYFVLPSTFRNFVRGECDIFANYPVLKQLIPIELTLMEELESKPREKKLLVLTCPTCERQNATPLGIPSAMGWVKVAAYFDCLSFCGNGALPKVGDTVNVRVKYPVCCKEGEVFSATFGDGDDFVTMRLLNIKKYSIHTAKLRVRILAMNSNLKCVKPVSVEEKHRLWESKAYDYVAPAGDKLATIEHVRDVFNHHDFTLFTNSLGGGDVWYRDCIFIDADGIDHLVQSCYQDFDTQVAYYGDKVIGFHQFSPYDCPPEVLPDGSLAPEIPLGFLDSLKRHVARKGLVMFLRSAIDAVKEDGNDLLGFDASNGLYTHVVFYGVGRVSIEGFLYAIKKVIDESAKATTTKEYGATKECYNELVREMVARSVRGASIEKYRM